MVKIFVGNLPREADQEEIEALFKEHGTVTECSIIKNFAFVHMDDRKAAVKAIKTLHLHKLHGSQINVEASHGKNQGAVKLHVANVDKGDDGELRTLFEEYGSVSECAVVKNFAFVHMCNSEEAMDAIKGLDNTEFQGSFRSPDALGALRFPSDGGARFVPRSQEEPSSSSPLWIIFHL
ncbi:RNA-binding protein 4B-like isoform X3 [Gadus chalcogrammus]|uniref:RNA-binding protein 4B-like isoform X4 n=1 Tax=Gadus chalcogrammus TaxID=1042646 RepID=UPI0024C48F86|nr:RNA-binding protein 4B-like isoform X4 [Gadus chalcogrammus]XP_056432061.1 RNA-binding protein 4B-like isoform X3 [Gadus chalcogrammus]